MLVLYNGKANCVITAHTSISEEYKRIGSDNLMEIELRRFPFTESEYLEKGQYSYPSFMKATGLENYWTKKIIN